MNIEYIEYTNYLNIVPEKGQHILAQRSNGHILVYQAFNPRIANFALENQYFGGSAYSYERMSWIKPNFLWMMYRCGWASKEHQQKVLGIWIKESDFEVILKEAVYSSYQAHLYGSQGNWKEALATSEVRLQWDPDHDIYGEKQERRAIQLGIKGNLLKTFGKEMIIEIQDLTNFAKQQKTFIDSKEVSKVMVPTESVFKTKDEGLNQHLGLV